MIERAQRNQWPNLLSPLHFSAGNPVACWCSGFYSWGSLKKPYCMSIWGAQQLHSCQITFKKTLCCFLNLFVLLLHHWVVTFKRQSCVTMGQSAYLEYCKVYGPEVLSIHVVHTVKITLCRKYNSQLYLFLCMHVKSLIMYFLKIMFRQYVFKINIYSNFFLRVKSDVTAG